MLLKTSMEEWNLRLSYRIIRGYGISIYLDGNAVHKLKKGRRGSEKRCEKGSTFAGI
jgi:hypothetical protein